MATATERQDATVRVLSELALLGPVRREIGRITGDGPRAGGAVLWHLGKESPLRLSDLAGALHVDLSVASRQVAELVAEGLVERRPDPQDRRACQLHLTGSGRTALDDTLLAIASGFADRLADWPPERLLRLADDLHSLKTALLPDSPTPTKTPRRTP